MPLTLVAVTDRTFPIFGKRLAQFRRKAGMSQEDLAGVIGRSLSGVAKMERQEVARVFHGVRPRLVAALKLTDEEFDREIAVYEGIGAPMKFDKAAFLAELAKRVHDGVLGSGEVIEVARGANGKAKRKRG